MPFDIQNQNGITSFKHNFEIRELNNENKENELPAVPPQEIEEEAAVEEPAQHDNEEDNSLSVDASAETQVEMTEQNDTQTSGKRRKSSTAGYLTLHVNLPKYNAMWVTRLLNNSISKLYDNASRLINEDDINSLTKLEVACQCAKQDQLQIAKDIVKNTNTTPYTHLFARDNYENQRLANLILSTQEELETVSKHPHYMKPITMDDYYNASLEGVVAPIMTPN